MYIFKQPDNSFSYTNKFNRFMILYYITSRLFSPGEPLFIMILALNAFLTAKKINDDTIVYLFFSFFRIYIDTQVGSMMKSTRPSFFKKKII